MTREAPWATSRLALGLLLAVFALAALRPVLPGDTTVASPGRLALLGELDANVRSGDLVAVWAAGARQGHGGPTLEFHPPLAGGVAEALLLLTEKPALAVRGACALFVLAALIGAFLTARLLVPGPRLAAAAAAGSYAINPFMSGALHSPENLELLAAAALLPWVAAAATRLAARPGLGRALWLAAAFAGLALADTTTAAIAALVLATAFSARARSPLALSGLFAGLGLGLAASFFHWGPASFERHLVAGLTLEPERTRFLPAAGAIYASGVLAASGLVWLIARGAGRGPALAWRRGSAAEWRQSLELATGAALCVLFAHRLSAPLYSRLPFPANPLAFVPFLALFGALLGARAASRELGARSWAWAALTVAIVAAGWAPAYPGENRDEHARAKATAGAAAEAPLTILRGRADGGCERRGPTRLRCEIMVVHAAAARVGVFDYPVWHGDDNGAELALTRDPATGFVSFNLAPGKHVVTVELRDTPLRSAAKTCSAVAWLLLALLLLQNQLGKRKALAP